MLKYVSPEPYFCVKERVRESQPEGNDIKPHSSVVLVTLLQSHQDVRVL